MQIERLKTLSAHLKRLKRGESPRVFDLDVWAKRLRKPVNGCGTAACALGEAGYIPAFRRLGLKTTADRIGGMVTYEGADCLEAAEAFFGLTRQQARALFIPRIGYRTAKHVARCIDTLVEAHALFGLQGAQSAVNQPS